MALAEDLWEENCTASSRLGQSVRLPPRRSSTSSQTAQGTGRSACATPCDTATPGCERGGGQWPQQPLQLPEHSVGAKTVRAGRPCQSGQDARAPNCGTQGQVGTPGEHPEECHAPSREASGGSIGVNLKSENYRKARDAGAVIVAHGEPAVGQGASVRGRKPRRRPAPLAENRS